MTVFTNHMKQWFISINNKQTQYWWLLSVSSFALLRCLFHFLASGFCQIHLSEWLTVLSSITSTEVFTVDMWHSCVFHNNTFQTSSFGRPVLQWQSRYKWKSLHRLEAYFPTLCSGACGTSLSNPGQTCLERKKGPFGFWTAQGFVLIKTDLSNRWVGRNDRRESRDLQRGKRRRRTLGRSLINFVRFCC